MALKKNSNNTGKKSTVTKSNGNKWATSGVMKPVDLSKIEFVNRPKKSK